MQNLPELLSAKGTPRMRALVAAMLPTDNEWGSCAAPFLKSSAYQGDVFPAPAFQRHLIQEVHPGSYLQFFSAGSVSSDGTRFDDKSTQAVFLRHRDLPMVIIAFRGTEPQKLNDVFADLEVWKTSLAKHHYDESWGSVHAGFLKAFESVEPLLMKKLDEIRDKDVTIWITGHSLGGALATLMTARLLEEMDHGASFKIGGVYTFGSPRVGDDAFVRAFDAARARHHVRSMRIRNASDAVTSIPGLVLDYAHIGTLAYLTENQLVIAPEDDPPYGVVSLNDHDIAGMTRDGSPLTGYYRRLAALEHSGKYPELDRCETLASP
jgi:hypothetical protein